MKTILSVMVCGLLSGCVSAPPGSRAGWSVSLIQIQLGGTATTVETQNYLNGTNIVQRHSLPIDADVAAPTTITAPGLP